MEDILYTVKDVAKLLKCNPDKVNELRRSGILKFMKLGCYKISRTALLKFLDDYEGKDVTDPTNIKELY